MPKFEHYFGDRCFKINGRPIMIDEPLTESEVIHLAQRQALNRTHYVNTSEQLLMKIRYDCWQDDTATSSLNPQDPLHDRDYTTDELLTECDLIEIVPKIGHGPRYITHLNTKAGSKASQRATNQ